jgi:hypothetical protein
VFAGRRNVAAGERLLREADTKYGEVFAWATVAVALAAVWPTGLTRRIGMRRIGQTQLRLGEDPCRLHVRRGALAALVAAAGAMAAVVWEWRPRSTDSVGHQTVARWVIPGGEGRFVVILPNSGAEELHAVADRLHKDFSRQENGVAMIFDDAPAARDVRRGSRNIGEERFRAALRHQRAMYFKHAARGEESLIIYTDYPLVRETFRLSGRREGTAR